MRVSGQNTIRFYPNVTRHNTRNDMENAGQEENDKMSVTDKASGSNADKIDKMIQDAANQMK